MNGLSCGEESMTICSAVLMQYQRVTEGQTDVQPIPKTCFSIADARKNDLSTSSLQKIFVSLDVKMLYSQWNEA